MKSSSPLIITIRVLVLLVSFAIQLAVGTIAHAKSDTKSEEPYLDIFELIFQNKPLARHKLDSLMRMETLTDLQRLHVHNINGIYHAVGGQMDSAFYYFSHVADKATDKNLRARAMHNLSIIYKERGDYTRAGGLVRQALQAFQELGNKDREAAMYGEMASIYNRLSFYDLALDYQLRSIEVLEGMPAKYQNSLYIEKHKLAGIYLSMQDYEFAVRILEQILPFFKARGDQMNSALVQINYSFALGQLGYKQEAVRQIDQAIQNLKTFQNQDLLSLAFNCKASIVKISGGSVTEVRNWYEASIESGRRSSGTYTFDNYINYLTFLVDRNDWSRAVTILEDLEASGSMKMDPLPKAIQYFEAKAKVLNASGRFEQSSTNWQKAVELKDSLSNLRLSRVAMELQDKYKSQVFAKEVEIEKLRADALERKVRNQTLNLFFVLLFAALISLVTIQYVRKNNFKQEQLQKLHEARELLLKEKAIVQQVMARQKQVIEEQQQQLMANVLEIANQNEKIEAILEKAGGSAPADVSKLLKGLKSSDQYWESLMLRFRHLNPQFMKNLQARFPQLTQSEIEFCALVRLNLSFKDIANLMQISHKSVFTKKYRITQKMKVGEDEDFFKVIHEIDT